MQQLRKSSLWGIFYVYWSIWTLYCISTICYLKFHARHAVALSLCLCHARAQKLQGNAREWQAGLMLLLNLKELRVLPDAVSYSTTICACGLGSAWQTALSLLRSLEHQRLGFILRRRMFFYHIDINMQVSECPSLNSALVAEDVQCTVNI